MCIITNYFESDVCLPFCLPAPKPGYSQGVTSYTQSQQSRQVTVIKPAAPSQASSTFSIYPVTSAVQPVAAAASVVPSYSQSPTYSTNAVTYSGKLLLIHFLHKASLDSVVLEMNANMLKVTMLTNTFACLHLVTLNSIPNIQL